MVTAVLVVVGWWQIMSARRQAKGWQTLAACEKYDLDPILDQCLRKLSKARRTGRLWKKPDKYSVEVTTVLNYLDGLAIGIEQNLYVESLVWDHLEPILRDHTREYLGPVQAYKLGIDIEGYKRLTKLAEKWGERRTRFWDGWSLWRK